MGITKSWIIETKYIGKLLIKQNDIVQIIKENKTLVVGRVCDMKEMPDCFILDTSKKYYTSADKVYLNDILSIEILEG